MDTSIDTRKPWQRKRRVQALAIVLGYILPLMVFISQLGRGAVTAQGFLVYAIGYTLSVSLNGLIMVLWYLRFGRIFHLIVAITCRMPFKLLLLSSSFGVE